MKHLKLLLALSLALTTLTGDYIVFRSKYSSSQLFRAIADSITHAAVGLLSSLVFFSHDLVVSHEAVLCNVIFCTIISSLIDVDHFILAKSFRLEDIANLKQRGILHCTTLWIIITLPLLIYSYLLRKSNVCLLTWMLIIAFSSHHIRDATRRGLWIYPFGNTAPLYYYFYVLLIVILPFAFAAAYKGMKMQKYSIEYTIV